MMGGTGKKKGLSKFLGNKKTPLTQRDVKGDFAQARGA
jgi:hypothetical protein